MKVGTRADIVGLVVRQFGVDPRALLRENNPFPQPPLYRSLVVFKGVHVKLSASAPK